MVVLLVVLIVFNRFLIEKRMSYGIPRERINWNRILPATLSIGYSFPWIQSVGFSFLLLLLFNISNTIRFIVLHSVSPSFYIPPMNFAPLIGSFFLHIGWKCHFCTGRNSSKYHKIEQKMRSKENLVKGCGFGLHEKEEGGKETQGCLMELFWGLKLTPFYYPIFRVASHISLSFNRSQQKWTSVKWKWKCWKEQRRQKDDKYQQHLMSVYIWKGNKRSLYFKFL